MKPVLPLPDWLDASIYPFDNHCLHVDGHTVHYVDEGSGPLLLLLRGNPSWSFVYRNIITELSIQFRCNALDYPGFGLSTAAPGYTFKPEPHSYFVERLITELGLTDIRNDGARLGADPSGSASPDAAPICTTR